MTRISQPRITRRARAAPAMDAAHREDLEAALELLRAELELEGRVEDGHERDGEDLQRRSLEAHLEGLGAALAEWESSYERTRLAPAALWSWLAEAATELGIVEPPFMLGPLVDTLAMLTVGRARGWQLDCGYVLPVDRLQDHFDGERHVGLYIGERMVARMAIGGLENGERVALEAERLVRALFDAAQDSAVAHEISDSRDALLALKQRLLCTLLPDIARSGLTFSPRCPICARAVAPDGSGGGS